MITHVLIKLFEKDLNKVTDEINLYPDDSSLWVTREGITNSGGNLCLHVSGSLQHFIGAVLGGSGYVRNRDAEFALKNITRKKLLDELEATRMAVRDALEQVSKKELEKEFPQKLGGETVTTEQFLLHMLAHLNYHTGQINYHRRLLTVNSE